MSSKELFSSPLTPLIINPFFAQCLIKLVGDVSWLIQVRDNASKGPTNQDGFS